MTFNGGASIAETPATLDGLGRPVLVQYETGPGTGQYGSVETQYLSSGQLVFSVDRKLLSGEGL